MKNAFKILFINEEGRISWTAVSAIAAIVLLIHTYIDIWWLGKQYDAALLSFALEIILVGLGVRGAQRGLQYLGEGVAGISRKGAAQPAKTSEAKQAPQAKQTQQPKQPIGFKGGGNFQLHEFDSKDGAKMPASVKRNVLVLIENLEVIRAELGGKPITISSGYRSKAHNSKVGGKPNSQHLLGNAADIKVKGMRPASVAKAIKKLMDDGKIEAGGLKAYSSFTHYDRRGDYVTW